MAPRRAEPPWPKVLADRWRLPTTLAQVMWHRTLRRNFSDVEHSAKLAEPEHQ
jgi:hypothetical protein